MIKQDSVLRPQFVAVAKYAQGGNQHGFYLRRCAHFFRPAQRHQQLQTVFTAPIQVQTVHEDIQINIPVLDPFPENTDTAQTGARRNSRQQMHHIVLRAGSD